MATRTRYFVTVAEESDDGMQTSERQAYLEEALAELGVWPSMGGQVAAMNEAVASGITDLAGRIDALDDRYTLLAERLMRNEREGAEAEQALEELGVWPSTNAAHTNARMPQRTITVAPIIDDGGYAVYYDDDPDDGLRVDVFPPYDGAPYVNITTQEIDMTPDQAISLSELLRAAARFAGTPEAARPPARPGPGGGDEQ